MESLLRAGHSPIDNDHLFPCALQLAAWGGNAGVLRLLQEHLRETETEQPLASTDDLDRQVTKIAGAITGAGLRGDLTMIRLAAHPPHGQMPDGNLGLSLKGVGIRSAVWHTRSWEVYQYLGTLSGDHAAGEPSVDLGVLVHHAELGNVDMVRHFLDAGADMHGGARHNSNPLVRAARFCQEAVVDLLLARGADPNRCEREQRGSALCAAAAGGSLAIVRKLADHGARPMGHSNAVLRHAVMLEHEAMVEFLWERGLVGPSDGPGALQAASEEGLESMVEVLHRYGVEMLSEPDS